MFLDLHSHSVSSDDSRATVEQYLKWIQVLRKREYTVDGFVLTEHRKFDSHLDYSSSMLRVCDSQGMSSQRRSQRDVLEHQIDSRLHVANQQSRQPRGHPLGIHGGVPTASFSLHSFLCQ